MCTHKHTSACAGEGGRGLGYLEVVAGGEGGDSQLLTYGNEVSGA